MPPVTEAAFRRGAFASPTSANLDPEAVAFAAWCAADLAADLAAFLAAITLPIGRVCPKQPKRGSQAGRNSVRVNSPCPGTTSGVDVVLDLMPPPGLGALTGLSPGAPRRGRRPFGRGRQARVPLVGQVLVSPGGHGRRRWPIWSPSRDLPVLADALGQALTALDRRPAWRPHHGGNGSNRMPGRIRFLMVMLSRPWSSFSPQKVRKTSINVHHQRTPYDTIRAGQRPFGG